MKLSKQFKLVINHLIIAIIIGLFFSIKAFAQETNIWSIGSKDASASEFALAPNAYKDFVPEGFGGAHKYYVIGESSPKKDFPYLLLGPKDGFAGYGYWAGLALNKLPIYFEIEKLPKQGNCQLNVDILAVSNQQAPLFRCIVNGQVYEQQLKKGTSKTPENLITNPQKITFIIPVLI